MKKMMSAVIAAALLAALVLAACDNSTNPGGGDATPPAGVTGLTAISGDGRVTLIWTDPMDADLASIEITVSTEEEGVIRTDTVTKAKGTTRISGLANKTPYTFTVKAVYAAGNKSEGEPVTAAPVKPLTGISGVEDYLEEASGGGSAADPVSLVLTIDLADTGGGWAELLSAIASANTYVALDLSACTMDGTEFDPGTDNTGKDWIVSFVLPDAAQSIKAGTYETPTFQYFIALKSVSGEGVKTIGEGAFYLCAALETVNFPLVETIGANAFAVCTALETVNFPAAQTIGYQAFAYCVALETVSYPLMETIGDWAFASCTALKTVSLPAAKTIGEFAFWYCTGLTTVTLGAAAPTLGSSMFSNINEAKTVTVLVPSSATGYGTIPETYSGPDTTEIWGNGFRGGGWDGLAFTDSGSINTYITLTIEYEANE